jgi:peroxiredoxin family protein
LPPLSKFHMSGLGKWMMLRLMKDAKSPALEEMIDLAKGMGVKFMACTTLR